MFFCFIAFYLIVMKNKILQPACFCGKKTLEWKETGYGSYGVRNRWNILQGRIFFWIKSWFTIRYPIHLGHKYGSGWLLTLFFVSCLIIKLITLDHFPIKVSKNCHWLTTDKKSVHLFLGCFWYHYQSQFFGSIFCQASMA